MKVLSKSVADGFMTLRRLNCMEANTVATEQFVRIFDNFFDLFNTRNLEEYELKLKPDLQAYYHTCDKRLQVCCKLIYDSNDCMLSIGELFTIKK